MKRKIEIELILETEHPDLVAAPKVIIAGAVQTLVEKALCQDKNATCSVIKITVSDELSIKEE